MISSVDKAVLSWGLIWSRDDKLEYKTAKTQKLGTAFNETITRNVFSLEIGFIIVIPLILHFAF